MQIIYADVLLLENLIIDGLMVMITCVFVGIKPKFNKLLFSALLGSAYALFSTVINLQGLLKIVCQFAVSYIMIKLALSSKDKRIIIRGVMVFYVISFVWCGISVSTCTSYESVKSGRISFFNITVCSFILAFLFYLFKFVFNALLNEKNVYLNIVCGSNNVNVKALIDNGNMAFDNISGKPVIIVRNRIARALIGNTDNIDFDKIKHYKIHNIVVKTVVGEGTLVVFTPDSIYNSKSKCLYNAVIAFLDESEEDFGSYEAIAPIMI